MFEPPVIHVHSTKTSSIGDGEVDIREMLCLAITLIGDAMTWKEAINKLGFSPIIDDGYKVVYQWFDIDGDMVDSIINQIESLDAFPMIIDNRDNKRMAMWIPHVGFVMSYHG